MVNNVVCRNDYDFERQVVFQLRSKEPLTHAEWFLHLEALARTVAKHSDWVYDELEHFRGQTSEAISALERRNGDLETLVALQSEQLGEAQARITKLEHIVALLLPVAEQSGRVVNPESCVNQSFSVR